jgi:hypothetical protein
MKVTQEFREHITKHLLNRELCKWLAADAFDFPLVGAPIDRNKQMTKTNFMLVEKRKARHIPNRAAIVCARLVAKRLAPLR